MESKIFNKTNLIVFLLLVLSVVVLAWLFLPKMVTLTMPKQEAKQEMRMEGVQKEHFGEQEQEHKAVDKNMPFVDPKTGSLIDGPGFERGDVEGVTQESLSTIPSNYYFLDDGANGEMSIQHNLCSKSCCSAQWPTPFKQKYDPYVCGGAKSDYVPSTIFCNNSFQDAGCLCLNKKQATFLYNRGGNGRELF